MHVIHPEGIAANVALSNPSRGPDTGAFSTLLSGLHRGPGEPSSAQAAAGQRVPTPAKNTGASTDTPDRDRVAVDDRTDDVRPIAAPTARHGVATRDQATSALDHDATVDGSTDADATTPATVTAPAPGPGPVADPAAIVALVAEAAPATRSQTPAETSGALPDPVPSLPAQDPRVGTACPASGAPGASVTAPARTTGGADQTAHAAVHEPAAAPPDGSDTSPVATASSGASVASPTTIGAVRPLAASTVRSVPARSETPTGSAVVTPHAPDLPASLSGGVADRAKAGVTAAATNATTISVLPAAVATAAPHADTDTGSNDHKDRRATARATGSAARAATGTGDHDGGSNDASVADVAPPGPPAQSASTPAGTDPTAASPSAAITADAVGRPGPPPAPSAPIPTPATTAAPASAHPDGSPLALTSHAPVHATSGVSVRMSLPSLGEVEIRVAKPSDGGPPSVVIAAARHDTRQIVAGEAGSLHAMLDQAGIEATGRTLRIEPLEAPAKDTAGSSGASFLGSGQGGQSPDRNPSSGRDQGDGNTDRWARPGYGGPSVADGVPAAIARSRSSATARTGAAGASETIDITA